MPVYNINGHKVNFSSDPTEADIDEAAAHFGTPTQVEPTTNPKSKGTFRTEVMGPVTAGLSQLAFDIPRSSMKDQVNQGVPGAKQAYDFLYPEQQTGLGKTLRFGAEATGLVKGGAAKLAGGVYKRMAPMATKLGGKILRGITTGSTFGAATSKPTVEEYGKNVAVNAGAGGVFSSVGAVAPKFFRTAKDLINPTQVAKEVRQSVFDLRKSLGEGLDEQITNLSNAGQAEGKFVDLSGQFQELKDIMKTSEGSGIKGDILRTVRKIKDPIVRKLVNRVVSKPESAKQLTLAESDIVKKAFQQGITKQGKFANWTPGDLEMLDLVDNIKLSQSEVFDNLAQIRAPYAEYMQGYNNVKNLFKPGRLLKGMRDKFGDEEINQLVQKIVPPETFKRINTFRRAGKAIKWGGGAAVTALGINELRNIFGNLPLK